MLADMVLRGAVTTPSSPRRSGQDQRAGADKRGARHRRAASGAAISSAASRRSRAAGVTIRRERVDVLEEVLDMTARLGTLTAAEAYHEYHEIIDSDRVSDDRPARRPPHHGRQAHVRPRPHLDPARTRDAARAKAAGAAWRSFLAMPTTRDHGAGGRAAGGRRRRCSTRSICRRCATPCWAISSTFAAWRCRMDMTTASCRRASSSPRLYGEDERLLGDSARHRTHHPRSGCRHARRQMSWTRRSRGRRNSSAG